MELATEIIISKHSDLYRKNDTLSDLSSLNLVQKISMMHHSDYKRYIDTNRCITAMTNFTDHHFSVLNIENISKGLLYAYYISGYSSDIFFWCETNFDMKLVHYANLIVSYLERTLSLENIDINEFEGTLDYYYSLYNLWSSKTVLKKLEDISENFIDSVETYSIIKQMDAKSLDLVEYSNQIKECINDMIQVDKYLAIKMILGHYSDFSLSPEITEYVWNLINETYSLDKFRTLSVIMSKLRKQLIFSTDDIKSRKNIYYHVDIDEFHENVRNSSINPQQIVLMINTLAKEANKQNKTSSLLPECAIESFNASFDIYVLTSLNKLFNDIYN